MNLVTSEVSYRSVRSNERLNGSGLIGGGFTGLWTALLAKESDPERSVVLVEGHRVGWAASGRNGGFGGASLIHELTRLKLVKAKPVPFPPESLAYLGIQATRWSLAQADRRSGRRNLWLRAFGAASLGFDS